MPDTVTTAAPSPPPGVPYGGKLMFTQSWEDPACDMAALQPLSGKRLVAITSGATMSSASCWPIRPTSQALTSTPPRASCWSSNLRRSGA